MKKKEIMLLGVTLILISLCFTLYNKSKKMIVLNEDKYTEIGFMHYRVHVTDNSYYGTDYLDEGMQYISGIIDQIELNYKYNIKFEEQDKFKINTNLTANVKIVDEQSGKVIYTKSDLLKNSSVEKNEVDINEKIVLDYRAYNELANDFKTKYGISANCKLSLNYVIQYKDEKTGISQSRLITTDIPLSEQMINITKSEDLNNSSSYIISTTESKINTVLFIIAIVLLVLSAFCIVKLIDMVKNRIDAESKYDRFIKKTLKEYDAYITVSKTEYNDYGKNKLVITSFKELLDVRNNLEKPIIYYKIDHNHSKFSIISDEIYEYKISRDEMDK